MALYDTVQLHEGENILQSICDILVSKEKEPEMENSRPKNKIKNKNLQRLRLLNHQGMLCQCYFTWEMRVLRQTKESIKSSALYALLVHFSWLHKQISGAKWNNPTTAHKLVDCKTVGNKIKITK